MSENHYNISVLVAGRPYKLKVLPEEENMARQASREINEQVQEFQDKIFSKDKQDFLAMIALQLKVDSLKTTDAVLPKNEWVNKLEELDVLLSSILEK